MVNRINSGRTIRIKNARKKGRALDKKGEGNYYAHKNHTKVDKESKLIKTYIVTDTLMHDSNAVGKLIDKDDGEQDFFADSAYAGTNVAEVLERSGMRAQIVERAYKDRPLTEEQKQYTNKWSVIAKSW